MTRDGSDAQAAADAVNAALRYLEGPQLEPTHPAQAQLTALWRNVGPTSDTPLDVAEWSESVFRGVLEPIVALLVECRKTKKLPTRVHVDALVVTEKALRRRFSKGVARQVVANLFERYSSAGHAGIDAKKFSGIIAVTLEHVFDCEVTAERHERIKVAVAAMSDVRGRGRKKDTLKWKAIADVLEAYGDPVRPASLRRSVARKPAGSISHVLKKGEI